MVISKAKEIVEKNARLPKEGDIEAWLMDDIQAICVAIKDLEREVEGLRKNSHVHTQMGPY